MTRWPATCQTHCVHQLNVPATGPLAASKSHLALSVQLVPVRLPAVARLCRFGAALSRSGHGLVGETSCRSSARRPVGRRGQRGVKPGIMNEVAGWLWMLPMIRSRSSASSAHAHRGCSAPIDVNAEEA